jgi:hypothetical protein
LMARLIRGLDMQEDKISALQGFERILDLAGVIRVEPTGGAGHADRLQSGIDR